MYLGFNIEYVSQTELLLVSFEKGRRLLTFICFKSSILTLGTSAVSERAEKSEV